MLVLGHHPQGGGVPLPGGKALGPPDEQQVPGGAACGGGEGPGDAVDKVLGGQGGAVAPLGVPPQVEGELRAVAVGFPAAGHPRDGLAVLVDAAQALKQGADDQLRRAVGGRLGVQGGDVLLQQIGKAGVCLVAAAAGAQAEQQRAQQHRNNPFSHGTSPFPLRDEI